MKTGQFYSIRCLFEGLLLFDVVYEGQHHTARGTKAGDEADGGVVIAVRVPAFSPFTALQKTGSWANSQLGEIHHMT